jgi:superkiller protein 3
LNRNSEAAVEYQQALGLLDAFLEDVPDAPSTLACRASVLKALGRADEALRDYQAAVQLKPKAQWLEAQGDLYSEFGNRSEAERSYHQALLLDPDRFDVLVALAKLISETKPTEAEPLLRRALELEPNSVAAMNDLGYFVLKAERFSEAEKIFKDALRIREDEFIRGQLAFVYFKQGRLSEAEAEHLKNCSQHPDSALALRLLGSYFSDVGKLEDAERVFRRAISIDPRRPESALRLATFLKQTGNFVEASQWARKAVELDPQNTEAIHLLEDLES